MILFPVKYTGPRMHTSAAPYISESFFQLGDVSDETETDKRQPAWNELKISASVDKAARSKLRDFLNEWSIRGPLCSSTQAPLKVLQLQPAPHRGPLREQKHGQGVFLPIIRYHFSIISINIAHGIVNCLHFRPSSPSSSDPASAVSFSVPVSQGAVNHPPVPFPPAFDTTADSPGSQSPSSAPQTPPCPLPPWRPPSRSPQAGSGRSTAPPPDGRSR